MGGSEGKAVIRVLFLLPEKCLKQKENSLPASG